MNDSDLIRAALHDFCGMLDVTELDAHTFVISTPFTFGDGDAYPLIVEKRDDNWRLTDRGGAAAHLFFDDLPMTEARASQIARIGEARGFFVSDGLALSSDLDGPPTAFDIADLIEAVGRVGVIADLARPAYTQYVHAVRREVESWVGDEAFQGPWTPSQDVAKAYPADALIQGPGSEPVALFVAGNDEKANRSVVISQRYKTWNIAAKPIAAYHPSVPPPAVVHLRDFIGDQGGVVVEVPPDDYEPLRDAFRSVGVAV